MRRFLIVAIAATVAVFSATDASSFTPDPSIVAHRGDVDDAAENTLEGIQRSIDSGAEALEFDVRYAGTNTPVIIHDATLDRTTNCTGLVTSRSATSLGTCDAGNDQGYSATKVPSLYDVMKLIHDVEYDGVLQVELKTVPTPVQAGLTLNRIYRFELESQVTFTSFRRDALSAIRTGGVFNGQALTWNGDTGWIFRASEEGIAWSLTEYSDLIPYGVDVSAEEVQEAHDNGVRVTLGSESWNGPLAAIGPDFLIVNQLDETLALREQARRVRPPTGEVPSGVPAL